MRTILLVILITGGCAVLANCTPYELPTFACPDDNSGEEDDTGSSE